VDVGFIRGLIMFFGFVGTFVAMAIGFGAVLLSRAGTRPLRPESTSTNTTCSRRKLVSDSSLIRLASVGLVAIVLAACDRASAQEDWQTFNASRQSAGEDLLRVKLEYGAGTLTMAPGESGLLYNANMRYDAGAFSPIHTTATVGCDSASRAPTCAAGV
jgi:hypothetical protein